MAKKKTEPRELLPTGCERCHSQPHVILPGIGARRCDCARGIRLSELDAERTGKPAAPASAIVQEPAPWE